LKRRASGSFAEAEQFRKSGIQACFQALYKQKRIELFGNFQFLDNFLIKTRFYGLAIYQAAGRRTARLERQPVWLSLKSGIFFRKGLTKSRKK
jgi:hypothetical protein